MSYMENVRVLEIGSWVLIKGKTGAWRVESQDIPRGTFRVHGDSSDIREELLENTVRYPELSYTDLHPLDLVKTSTNSLLKIQSVHISGINCEDSNGRSVFMRYEEVYPISLDYDSWLLLGYGIDIDKMLDSLKNELALREIQGSGAIILSLDRRGLTFYSGKGINIKLTNFKYYHEFIKIFNKYSPI